MSTLLSSNHNTSAKDSTLHVIHGFEQFELQGSFWQAYSAFKDDHHAFLLDSSLTTRGNGRFSFMGAQPVAIFQARRIGPRSLPFESEIEIQRFTSIFGETLSNGPEIERICGDALAALRRLLKQYAVPFGEEARGRYPFLGGAVGFFGYESGSWNGPVGLQKPRGETTIPDIYFPIYDRVLCHDSIAGETYLSAAGRGKTRQSAIEAVQRAFEKTRETLRSRSTKKEPIVGHQQQAALSQRDFASGSDFEKEEGCFDETKYCDAVSMIRSHIEDGDIYQACMTQRFQCSWKNHDPWQLYSILRAGNPAPFACFLEAPNFQIVSASPERYLSLDRSGWAESRPIKGTRPRGKTTQNDETLRQELADSEKDRAENVMIVDLVRNDFGQVCRFGSINVSDLMKIETYATVFQMVSTVRGKLAADRDGLDLIRATFPGGSMTGAPKIEAMKILDRLEPVRRGIYSGAIGYLDYAGSMDLNMVIRSFIIEGEHVSYHAGGGVVADSSPEEEYQESLDKVVALQTALGKVFGAAIPRSTSPPQ